MTGRAAMSAHQPQATNLSVRECTSGHLYNEVVSLHNTTEGGGNRGSLANALRVCGAPNSAELIQTRSSESGSSFTSIILLHSVDFKLACFLIPLRC